MPHKWGSSKGAWPPLNPLKGDSVPFYPLVSFQFFFGKIEKKENKKKLKKIEQSR